MLSRLGLESLYLLGNPSTNQTLSDSDNGSFYWEETNWPQNVGVFCVNYDANAQYATEDVKNFPNSYPELTKEQSISAIQGDNYKKFIFCYNIFRD